MSSGEAVSEFPTCPGFGSLERFSLAATAAGISGLIGGFVGMLMSDGIGTLDASGIAPNNDCEMGGVGSSEVGFA